MKKTPVSVANLLNAPDKKFNPLISEAKKLAKIKIIVNQSLDYQLAEHIFVSKVQANALILVTDSPVWATRLRYIQQDIISRLKQHSFTRAINKIIVKVRPLNFLEESPKTNQRKMSISSTSAQNMLKELKAISDPKLKDKLMRIAKRAK